MGRVIIVTLFFKISSDFALCNENQKHRIIASMHAAQIYKFHDRLEVDGELSTCIRRVKNTYAPNKSCLYETKFAGKPGTYLTGVVITTEHLENSFYGMKKVSRANNQQKDKFSTSYGLNQSLGTNIYNSVLVHDTEPVNVKFQSLFFGMFFLMNL